jgi:hypothetical protein
VKVLLIGGALGQCNPGFYHCLNTGLSAVSVINSVVANIFFKMGRIRSKSFGFELPMIFVRQEIKREKFDLSFEEIIT